MLLKRIRLRNIRTFVDSGWIDFDEGTISIIGENGSGKSTIVNSIGHVIFHHDAEIRRGEGISRSKRDFLLRRGAKNGKIESSFILNGEEFRATTKITESGQSWELFKNGIPIALHTRREIIERLLDEMGIRERYRGSIGDYFAHIICVMQGEILQPFEKSRQDRMDHFDRVLGISSYREAEQNARYVSRYFELVKEGLEKEIIRLEGEIEGLPNKLSRLKQCKKDHRRLSFEMKSLEEDVEALDKLKNEMDEIESQLNRLKQEIESMCIKNDSLMRELSDLRERLEECREAENRMRKLQSSKNRYEEVAKRLKIVRRLVRVENDRIKREKVVEGSVKELKAECTSLKKKIEEINEKKEELNELKSLYETYIRLKEELDELREMEREKNLYSEKLDGARANLNACYLKKEELKGDLKDFDRIKRAVEKKDEIKRVLDEMRMNLFGADEREKKIMDDLERLKEGGCPYTGEACPSVDIVERELMRELMKVDEEKRRLKPEISRLSDDLAEIADSRERLSVLIEKKRQIDGIMRDIEELQRNIDEYEKKMDKIGDIDIKSIEMEISGLEEGAWRYTSIKKDLDGIIIEKLDEKLGKEKIEIERRIKEIKRLEVEIECIKKLGGTVENEDILQMEKEGLEEDYKEYERSKERARDILEILDLILEKDGDINDINCKIEENKEKKMKLERKYDLNRHENVKIELKEKSGELQRVKADLKNLSERIEELKAETEELERKKDEMERKKVEQKEVNEDITLFESIRAGLKRLSEIRSLYTNKISKIANSRWKEVTNDPYDLIWDENYLLYKRHGDEIVTIFEMSTGERISASLSVRLALQEFIGGLGIFILDEPTIHLDDVRCENLAKEIANIRGLNQIFVVSHDDTFDAYTDQHIGIEKEDNVSRVIRY